MTLFTSARTGLDLPSSDEGATEATSESQARAQARILVVDDDPRNLLALAEVLGDSAEVVCAGSGEEALRWLLKEQFAVIILDVLMPGMDGYETAQLVRRREQSRDTPIIFLTAINKEDAHLLKGYDSGAVDYVFKPLQPLVVRSKVSVFVSLYEKTREIERKAAAQEQLLQERLEAQAERTKAVEALRQSEERQHVLLRSLPLILYTQENGKPGAARQFVAGNVAALTGFAADVFLREPDLWHQRIHPEDVGSADAAIVAGERSCGFRWRHADGSYRYFLDQAIALPDRQGLIAGTVRDATEQHLLQEQLLQAQKMDAIGKLTGGIAHDFNNLLASVLGGLSLIERRSALDERSVQIMEMTRHALVQGKHLIDRMLTFSRRQSLSPQPVDLEQIEHFLDPLLAPLLGGLVSLRWDIAEGPWLVVVDQPQLELAVMNLVINARDALPAGGTVTISLANRTIHSPTPDLLPGNYIMLSIADTGSGIPSDLLDKVVEPFFTTKEVGKGTGLGLSTAYGFARQSGGALRIHSATGVGTTVEIWLPRGSEIPVPPTETVAQRPPRVRESLSVLLVDDSNSLRDFTQAQLAAEGYRVDVAAGGAEALAMIERSPETYDVIVTDFAMPAISGLDVVKFARNMRANYPAVLMTGYADQTLLASRPADVPLLSKPFSLEDLIQAITTAKGVSSNT
jgi:CheY-like chemotaxis protein/nitrogen-specific signal transduction histidine kinase